MEDEPVNTIRATSRTLAAANRRIQRDEESDFRRCLSNLRYYRCLDCAPRFLERRWSGVKIGHVLMKHRVTKFQEENNVADIANKLKSKSQVTLAELQILKNALMDDAKYIATLLSVHGALRGLVREITGDFTGVRTFLCIWIGTTAFPISAAKQQCSNFAVFEGEGSQGNYWKIRGHDVKKQCAAAGCCCNLALGDSRACHAIAKAAGPYLIAALDNLTTELAVTSAWTIGNLAGSDVKVADLLITQGAATKLAHLLSGTNEELQEAALYALLHIAWQTKDDLSEEHITRILQAISLVDISPSSAQLLFIISCHTDFSPSPEIIQKVLDSLYVSTKKHVSICKGSFCCEFIYLIRFLANSNSDFYEDIVNYFVLNNMSAGFKEVLNMKDVVSESVLWLLGNLFRRCSDSQFFELVK